MGSPAFAPDLGALLDAGAFERAATSIVEQYGDELFGFPVQLLANEGDAAEVFSQVGEDLWRGLPSFQRRCSPRSWLYALARNAAANYRRSPWRRRETLTGDSRFDLALRGARTPTPAWHRTDVKDGWRELREALSEEDRTLLVLRIDRHFGWDDVARVTLGPDEAEDVGAVTREAARLRKRFQLLRHDLRERARAAGLIDDER